MAMLPMFGLCDTASIVERISAPSYGNIEVTETTIIAAWKCRKTEAIQRTVNEIRIQIQGEDRDDSWYFTGEYNALVKEGHIIVLGTIRYEIARVEIKRDAFGKIHHMYLTTRIRE
jgi:hypothetical protein